MRFSLLSKIIVAISVGWVLFFSFIHYHIWFIPLFVLVFCLGVLFILEVRRAYKTKKPAPEMTLIDG
jgi:F0F1-type ATP synthase assembly protein I